MSDLKNEQVISKHHVLHTRVITGNGGGPEKTILNSPRFLSELGYESSCAFMHPPNDEGWSEVVQRATVASADIISVVDRGPLDWQVIRQFSRICREKEPLIWHAHDYKSNALGLLLSRRYPIRLVTTVHGWTNRTGRGPLYYKIDKFCLPKYEKVICVSEDLYKECLRAGVRSDRCMVIDNAIDDSAYVPQLSRKAAREKINLPADGILIGSVGRLSPEKGFDLLIEAVQRLRANGRSVNLALVGSGPERVALQNLIEKHHLSQNVQLLGYMSDPRLLYQALDIFALSSYREGLPNVLLEAMATGLPSVATNVAGVPKLLKDKEHGLVVLPGSVDELCNALECLIASSALREIYGDKAQQHIRTRFSFKRRMRSIAAVYDSLVAGNLCDSTSQQSTKVAAPQ